jgi:flagellin
MSLTVNTNQSSLITQRLLRDNALGLDTSFERLASGFRINRAADDAAGLVITSGLTSQIDGLQQATRNANDAISLAQVADGAIGEIFNSLQRMRVLTIQSENGINSAEDIAALQKEFDQMRNVINNIASNTEFGAMKLLDGTAGNVSFLIGANSGQKAQIALTDNFSTDNTGLSLDGYLLGTSPVADILGAIDNAIKVTDSSRTELGAVQNALTGTMKNLSNIVENVSASRSRIKDTDYARETTALTRHQILQQSSLSVLAQANQRPQAVISVLNST